MFGTLGLAVLTHAALCAAAIITILRRRKEPDAMLAWIFAVVTLPVVGVVVYFLIGSDRIYRRAGRKRRRIASLLRRFQLWAEHHAQPARGELMHSLPEDLQMIERLGRRLSHLPATGGNEVHFLQEANETYAALESAIRAATEHVHLQYYIWQADETGRHFVDLLIEKAREGVECRLLLDSVGCWRFPWRMRRALEHAGVKVSFFLPMLPFMNKRWSLNLRNHRKIAVIDGRTAFLGSQNIGDEYRGRRKKFSPWYDGHLSIRGPAVLFVQQVFAEDWLFATYERLTDERYFPEPAVVGGSIVQLVPTGPEQESEALTHLIYAAVASARHSVRIETPYFVPGAAVRAALKHAAFRGVRVELVLPTRSDQPLVLWAGRSFYAELIRAGVHVYEFDQGVLHSKLMSIDDRWCMVGSANMDVRSFRLNFELTAMIYDERLTQEVTAAIEGHLKTSRQITLAGVTTRSFPRQMREGVARLFAPLL